MKKTIMVLAIAIVCVACAFAYSDEVTTKEKQRFISYDIPYYYYWSTSSNASGSGSSNIISLSSSSTSRQTGFGTMITEGIAFDTSLMWLTGSAEIYARYRVKIVDGYSVSFLELGIGLGVSATTYFSYREESYSGWFSSYLAAILELSDSFSFRVSAKASLYGSGYIIVEPQVGFGFTV